MNLNLLSVWRIIFCGLDVLMFYSFFHAMFLRRLSKTKSVLCFAAMTLTIVIENSFGITWLNLISLPVLYMIFSKAVFQVSASNSIVYTIIYYAVFAGGREVAFEILYRLLTAMAVYVIPPWFSPGAIPFLVVEYVLSILFLMLIEKYIKGLDIRNNNQFCWYLLIMPVASLLILMSFLYVDFPDARMIQILMCLGAFLLYFSNAAIFIILARFTQTMNQIRLAELASLKKNLEKTNFERIEKVNAIYREKLHDTHHYYKQLRHLAVLGETQSIIDIIDGLEGKMNAVAQEEIKIGDSVLNSILAEHCGQAEEQGIAMTVFVEAGLRVDFITDIDKISIFGNLLSNAIEAASKCDEGRRQVSVRMWMGNEYLLIFQVKNSHMNVFKKDGNRLLSTKKDAESHGLGVGIVRDLAEKYGGSLDLSQDGEWFTARLMLSNHSGKH